MPFYSEELIEEVRSANDIVDVISGYVRLQKKGSTHFGLCPFHNERTPSFSVSQGKQMYYCFGCGAGGNVITFLMQYENATFREAMETLAGKAGIELPKQELSGRARQEADRRARLLEINKVAAKYFYAQLRMEQGKTGMNYFTDRGLSGDIMKKFGLGYANKFSDDLYQYLRQQGYEDSLLKDSGLVSIDEKRGGQDKFWNRVMYPIQDINNRVIGFGGRVMGEGEPKYLNSPETPVFDKRRNLYGLNYARRARSNNIILCEGYMDVIAMHQAGFGQAVASLGTAFTSEQAALLRRYAQTVLLAYDSDGAGVNAAMRAIGILKESGLRGRVIDMKPYKDPDEFMKNLGAEAFEERISQAQNSFFFELSILERDYQMEDPESRTNFHREIAKKLCGFEEEVERENYIEAVAQKYHIGFDNLRRLVSGYAARTGLVQPAVRPKSTVARKNTPEENAKRSQRLLLTWITEEPALYPKIRPYIAAADFTEPLYKEVAERLFTDLEKGIFQPAAIVSTFEDEQEQRAVAEIFNTQLQEITTPKEREKAFHDIIYAVKKNSFEYYSGRMGSDMNALSQVIAGKKALEELSKTHISL